MDILRFIGTSKVDYTIIDEKKVLNPVSKWGWSDWSKWKKVKSPVAYKKTKAVYTSKKKDYNAYKTGDIHSAQTIGGTSIPSSKTVTIDGINYSVPVKHQLKGRVIFTRPQFLRNDRKLTAWKMHVTTHDPTKRQATAYWYRTKSQSIPTYETTKGYEKKSDGYGYLYFSKRYYVSGTAYTVAHPYPHPTTCNISYVDITKNNSINNKVNEGDRDSKGYYILKAVRSSVVTLEIEWTGLTADQTEDILKVLSPDVRNNKDYLLVQYYDPEKGKCVNNAMFCNSRNVVKYANGITKSLTCTLVEV